MMYNFSSDKEWKEIFQIARELAKEKLKDMKKVIFDSILKRKKNED